MTAGEKGTSSLWTFEEDKAFENAIATFPEDSEDWWEKIADEVPGKTLDEIKQHYDILVEDVKQIDSGRVALPNYSSSSEGDTSQAAEDGTGKKGGNLGHHASDSNHGSKASRSEQERRKGIAWTEDEHRLFLLGLEKYGKGDWRSISRNFVLTRTPTQVASHAQKYFIRLNSMNKDRRRSSIHDITSVNNGDVAGPITGQTSSSNNNNAAAATGGPSGKPNKAHPTPTGPPGVAVYGAPTIGQPIGGPMVSAVGTPVGPPHMAYGVRAPVPGSVVPGAPINMTYPMPHPAAHR
nr:transcription factor MYB 3 [Rheum palmatum]